MKIEIGTHRVVIINRWFTAKFPRIWISPVLKIILKSWKRASRKAIKYDIKQIPQIFLQGFRENMNEYLCWKETKASFLAPTYFSVGIVEIQKTICGEELSMNEMIKIANGLHQLDGIRDISPHSYRQGNNYHKSQGRIFMIDYGGKNLRQFIGRHILSLEKILNPKG